MNQNNFQNMNQGNFNNQSTYTDPKQVQNYQNTIKVLEDKIRNNQFASKEELFNYIQNLRNSGIPETIVTNEKIQELLNLFDSTKSNANTDPSLNMSNYKGISLEEQNLVVSKQTDAILKTENSPEELATEFKQVQNQITANNQDGLANADAVFNHMANNQKEQISLLPIEEAINRDNIDSEVLNKIRYFITNKYIEPYGYQVDPESGIFYNKETTEVIEVRKDEKTGEYKIYKGGEIVYGENDTLEEQSQNELSQENNEPEKENETNQEEMAYDNRLSKQNVKVRRLVPLNYVNDRAAFAKTGFLILGVILLAIATVMIILLSR